MSPLAACRLSQKVARRVFTSGIYIPLAAGIRISYAHFDNFEARKPMKVKKFCWTPIKFLWDKEQIVTRIGARSRKSTMKTLLTAILCSIAFALTSLAQQPAPAQQPPPPAQQPPPAGQNQPPPNTAPGAPANQVNPLPPGQTAPAPGMSVAPGAPVTGASGLTAPSGSPAVSATLSPAASAVPEVKKTSTENFLIDNFRKGGPVMWPILMVSIIGVTVVIERIFWWAGRWARRDPKRIEKVFTAIEVGDVAEASRLSRDSRDPVLRMMWNGLNHQHASLQGALQVAAGIEIKRAGRFLVVMDTLVTLAPLLGLLGTIVGLMQAFGSLGNEELAIQAVTGGISVALIATACGLAIAIFALVPFNFFTSRVSNLEFELQTAATNLEVMLEANAKAKREAEVSR